LLKSTEVQESEETHRTIGKDAHAMRLGKPIAHKPEEGGNNAEFHENQP
jgi:hypothetical protein